MPESSEQAVPFFDEAAREAAVVAADDACEDKDVTLGDVCDAALTAALNALSSRSKAILELARLSDEELRQRAADVIAEHRGHVTGAYDSDREIAAAVLAALGLPVAEQSP